VALFIALDFEWVKAPVKAIFICIVILPLLFFLAYKSVDAFAERVDRGIADVRTFDINPDTSMGQRFVFWATSFKLFKQNPLIGIGSGDFPNEYAKEKAKEPRWLVTPDTRNPHNQYLMTSVSTGLIGLGLLFFLFFKVYTSTNETRLKSLLIGYAAVCFVESYLWRSNTALTFSVLVAALLAKSDVPTA
jgi:O-antigen ligase